MIVHSSLLRLLCLSGFFAWLSMQSANSPSASAAKSENANAKPIAYFTDVAQKAGLTAPIIFGGEATKKYIIETTGTGVAIFDYDNDGWPDIFVVNGTKLEGLPSGKAPTSHLYRNNHDGTFTDVTEKAGLTHSGWGQGVCVGDYDNDGFEDLYVTYYGKNVLYHNNGDGAFTDVSEKVHVAGSGKAWGTGCAFIDYDRDGKLDLIIANYVDFDSATALAPGERPSCMWKGVPVMCGPRGLPWAKNILYHNLGNGAFEDVTTNAHIDQTNGHYGFSVSTFDYDDDGWPDIYVACDSTASILYHNNGDGTFDDKTFPAGFGLNTRYLGWGVMFLDVDNDGWPDLVLVNGHVYPEVDSQHLGSNFKEPKILYHNNGNGTFTDISADGGPGITAVSSARGLAVGDLWNDGRMSAVISNMNAPPMLLVNDLRNGNHWIAFRTIGTKSNRDGIGAKITVKAGTRTLVDEVRSGSSYISNSDMRVHFGLGSATKIDWVQVRWPSGLVERFENFPVDSIHTLKEGSGTPVGITVKKN